MASWRETNARIDECRRSPNPEECLVRLFEDRNDGHVAFALGELFGRRGDCSSWSRALSWYEAAERLYPLPAYKSRARTAASRVRLALRDCDEPGDEEQPLEAHANPAGSRLVIVGCTKQKIWDDDRSAPDYVAARRSYTGRSLPDWVRDGRDEPSGARWLFLSAKYGFIEPDHPICAYDVTFSDPATGPISPESLRAQVQHQTRWGDVPLASFTDREVRAGETYRKMVEYAFASLPSSDPPRADDRGRAQALGEALAKLTPDQVDAIDRGEPEWRLLASLKERVGDHRWLTAIALGLTDFQLGDGGAQLYWQIAEREIEDGPPVNPDGIRDVIQRIVRHPVAAKSADLKLRRIDRLLQSPLPRWLAAMTPDRLLAELPELWRRLASAMNQDPSAKTIVFAVKLVDLMVLQDTGERAALPDDMPIAVDIRIARAAYASGILEPPGGETAAGMIRRSSAELLADRAPYVRAWQEVAGQTTLSPLRLDSVIWQGAGHLRPGRPASAARASIAGMLVGYGVSTPQAGAIAAELTAALGDR
jgi:N-glycosylase/DNA lyase